MEQLNGFKYIGIQKNVCGGEPTILGRRIKPENIVNYGTKEEIMEDFDLTAEQVEECYLFIKQKNKKSV